MKGIEKIAIRGAGLSGLSIARELLHQRPTLSISIFDLRPRLPHPQRTFCFFHEDKSFNISCETHSWNSIGFKGASFERRIEVPKSPYTMIRGDAFFDNILQELESAGVAFHWSCTDVNIDRDSIMVNDERYTFDCVIDAAFSPTNASALLWQSFAGLWVSTKSPAFDPSSALLMDIGESSVSAPVSFLYVLPTSSTTALVEHTTFSPTPLPQDIHLKHCFSWLNHHLSNEFEVLEHESGAIPMGLRNVAEKDCYRTGSNAGTVRPATGYAFLATQRHARSLSEHILKGDISTEFIYPRWLELGDRLFLQALRNSPLHGRTILERLISRAPSRALVAFLSGDASLRQAVSVWLSAPKMTMLKALAQI
jgi:lycopene beta-cyclase